MPIKFLDFYSNIKMSQEMTNTILAKQIKTKVENDVWIIYRQPVYKKCPNCEILENLFKINNIFYESVDIYTPESATELAMHDCFPKFTPVLQKGDYVYYKQLWLDYGISLNIQRIKWIVDPNKTDWIDLDIGNTECKDGICRI